MKIRRSVRRAVAWVVAVAVLAQTTACSYVPARPDERTCEQEKAEVLAAAKDQTGTQDAIFFNATIDGRRTCAATITKGDYDVRVFATWSDGKTEEIYNFYLNIEPGRQYSVRAYESGAGHVPATAILAERQTSVTNNRRNLPQIGKLPPPLLLVVLAGVIVILPFVIAGKTIELKQAKEMRARQARDCCYAWIEDARTREIFGGTAPSAQ